MFSFPIPNYACEPILAVKQGMPVLFWEALFRGKKVPEASWEVVEQKLFEFLANNRPADKWKRITVAVNLSTDSVLWINEAVVRKYTGNQPEQKLVEDVLKTLACVIKDEAIANGEFTLQDIAKFKISVHAVAERRNPRTGEMFHSPEKKVVKITSAKVLKDVVN